MKVGLTTIAYSQTKNLGRLVQTAASAQGGIDLEVHIFMHSMMVSKACSEIKEWGAIIHGNGKNRGVARSWNDGILYMMESGCEVMVICNDDVWFDAGDVLKIAECAMANRDRYAVFCAGWHEDGYEVDSHGMACFAINPIAIGKVGMFDENFFPAYNEDTDYARRARLFGLEPVKVAGTHVHHIGSAALKANSMLCQQNHLTHQRNDQYWALKWNCAKHFAEDPKVGFPVPFNSKIFTNYIDPDNRHAPYPGRNRTDHGIVRI